MLPPVQLTAALARTANPDDSFDELWLRSAEKLRLEGPLESVLHAAVSNAAKDATTANRAVSRDSLNMVPPQLVM
jgi:hypothetical protein